MKIFISAGDPSGDLHGSNLIKELKIQNPQVEICGFGGSKMASVGNIFDRIADASIIGFWEPVKNLVRLKRDLKIAEQFFIKEKPAGVVLIDYYGFNIHIAKAASKHKIPVIYFICPQVWATRIGRLKTLKKYIKKALVIFPFEKEIYRNAGIDCEFVGHPFLDIIPDFPGGHSNNCLNIGLMPGSRIQEINKHFTPFYKAFLKISEEFNNAECIIPVFSDKVTEYIKKYFKFNFEKVKFIPHDNYKKRAKMDFCITSSGTSTVENMILGVPMVIVYKTSFLTYTIAKALINIKHIGMVNILAGKMVSPELIQKEATSEKIAEKCIEILKNKSIYEKTKIEFREIKQKFGVSGTTRRVAKIVLDEFKKMS
ncbi:MAG: lipid-A-disaccharide synthase [Elusimicrobia bacterium]|nr:lipid-A-disaccharide synthase [Elusimicrobiota bacterium]